MNKGKRTTAVNLEPTAALHFRDQLREARLIALRDAEAFEHIVFVLERIGIHLTGRIGDLGQYKDAITQCALQSPLAYDIPATSRDWHTTFEGLYELVRNGRNDALHEGAFARHLTVCAIELATILEDALMAEATRVRDFMIRQPVCALLWQPVSSVRQIMLANSFSYLPVAVSEQEKMSWYFVSDFAVATFLRAATNSTERKKRLACKLQDARKGNAIEFIKAQICRADDLVVAVLAASNGMPVLVLGDTPSELRGLVTPFDLL